jgi:curli production assembly/transport component CsgG
VPIERENIGNLLQERNLIRSTRQEYTKDADPSVPQITPYYMLEYYLKVVLFLMTLILSQVVLVLGILVQSYQIQTGQGNHLPTMVSTSNGKILKSVYFKNNTFSSYRSESFYM